MNEKIAAAETSTVLVSIVLNAGVDVGALARAAGVSERLLRDSAVIDYEAGMRIWDAAEWLSGDPAVGLHAGAAFGVDQLGALGASFALAPTLRAAFQSLPGLLALVIRGAKITFDEDAEGASFRYRSPGSLRHGVDAMFAALLSAARQCTRIEDLRPVQVRLQAPPPADAEPYRRVLGVRPTWHQPISELRFANADLDAAMRGADPAGAALMMARAGERFGGPPRDGALERLEGAVVACLPRGDVSIEAVARELGTSARTLQRRLEDAGTTFTARRDAVLRRRADALLARDELGLEQIAERLAFSSRGAFSRAYRRWTGRSPADVRRASPAPLTSPRRGPIDR